jgi:hypothetical protein
LTLDDFVRRPISALRIISLALRRTVSTPRATRFARLDLGLFTKSSKRMTFYESITLHKRKNAFPTAAWLKKYLKFAPVRPIDNPKPSAAGTVAGRSLGAAMRRVAGNTHNLIYYLQTA